MRILRKSIATHCRMQLIYYHDQKQLRYQLIKVIIILKRWQNNVYLCFSYKTHFVIVTNLIYVLFYYTLRNFIYLKLLFKIVIQYFMLYIQVNLGTDVSHSAVTAHTIHFILILSKLITVLVWFKYQEGVTGNLQVSDRREIINTTHKGNFRMSSVSLALK